MTDRTFINLRETLLRLELPCQIIHLVAAAGGEARYVGGVVRDLLAGIPLAMDADIDMAGTLPPEKAAQALKNAGLRVIPTGIKHGTITVMAEGKNAPKQKVELTTLRQDIKTDGRHAEVVFGTDWAADAARRDFTINSIYADAEGRIFDPFGGVEDLNSGKVRFIGDPTTRIREDYLRMLRYFRFFARFSRGDADEEAMAAMKRERAGLRQISGERIAAEIKGILKTRSVAAIDAMIATGIDQEIVAGGFSNQNFSKLVEFSSGIPPILLLGFLVGDAPPDLVAERLRLSNAEHQLLRLAMDSTSINELEGQIWQREAWSITKDNRLDTKTISFLYSVWAIRVHDRVDMRVFKRLRDWQVPVFPVTGGDLMDRGFHEGEALGQALATLEEYWIDQGFKPDRDELLNSLDALPSTR
ncbi:CCA tRNA nucleotidyltransferase [Alphaproteobacteria bacterium LSUCC0684]